MPIDPIEITGGLAIGTGLGGAIEDTVKPRLELFRQSQWEAHADIALPPGVAAEVAAENYDSYGNMTAEAARNGYNAARFQHLYDVTVTAPGMGELLTMLRRGTISGANFQHGLDKARLEPMWSSGLADLANVYIGIGDIAYAIVRGILPAPSYVPVAPPKSGDKVPRYPQVNIDPVALAGKLGYSPEMLEIMVGRSGLSMAPGMAAQALFREIIGPNDYLLAIAEGDLRTEWADPVREVSRQIPTAGEAVQYQLRGFTDAAGRYALTRLHGMTDANSDILYNIAGRAPSDRQVYIGLARGAKYPATYADVPSPFREAIQRSDIRPEFADIVYQNRYSLPSAFVVRSLLTDGAIDAARGSTILQHEGWPPDLADLVASHYAASGGTAADPHVTKAQNQLWTTTHTSYKAAEIDNATATASLGVVGVNAAAVPEILTIWAHERSLVRKQLSPAQVKKAYRDGIYTQAEATQKLLDRGYDQAEATVLLEE